MSLELGKTYFIRSAATCKYLNVYGNETISVGRNVNTYSFEDCKAQKWIVERKNRSDFGVYVESALNTGYTLNIYSESNPNCTVYPYYYNGSYNSNDAMVDFLTVDARNNQYRIKLVNHNRYLCVSPSDGDVYWSTDICPEALWVLEEASSSSSTPVPTTATVENLCQKNYGPQEPDENSYCFATCILAILRHYKGTSYDMDWLVDNGVVQECDGWVLRGYSSLFTMSGDIDIDYTAVCNEISAGRPVIVKGTNSRGGYHFVVADGFTSRTRSGITVMDPWTGEHMQLSKCAISSVLTYRTYTNL